MPGFKAMSEDSYRVAIRQSGLLTIAAVILTLPVMCIIPLPDGTDLLGHLIRSVVCRHDSQCPPNVLFPRRSLAIQYW